MYKRFLSLMLVACIVCSLLLCMTGCSEGKKTDAAGTHVVVDHNGNKVAVPNDVQRIAVCDIFPLPSVLTVFFDSAEKIVGMAPPSMLAAKSGLLGELYPEILKAETGYIDGANVNIEELMKLNPDVVFYSASNPELGEKLRAAGLAALAVSVNKWDYNAIETLNHWIELFNEVIPQNDKAEKVRKASEEMYDLVQSRVSTLSDEERERAFFLFQYSETNILTSGRKFFGEWWAEAIGAKNVAYELENDNSVAVNMEQVYAWNPSLIFITNFNTAVPETLYTNEIGNYDWSEIEAVRNRNVYKMPLGMYRSYTPGVDTPITLIWLAKSAYPELFADIDVVEKTVEYYRDVFGVTLTTEQANSIFAPPASAGEVVVR